MKQIFKQTFRINKIRLRPEPKYINVAEDFFNDAEFFHSQILITPDEDRKLTYKRASLIFYCASTEAYINSSLRNIIRALGDGNENDLQFTFLQYFNMERDEFVDWGKKVENNKYSSYKRDTNNYSRSIYNRLYYYIGMIINGSSITGIDEEKKPLRTRYNEFEEYLILTKIRNSLLHYSYSDQKKIYDEIFSYEGKNLTNSEEKAKETIINLFTKINEIYPAFSFPHFIP